jgi:hypothetical protein
MRLAHLGVEIRFSRVGNELHDRILPELSLLSFRRFIPYDIQVVRQPPLSVVRGREDNVYAFVIHFESTSVRLIRILYHRIPVSMLIFNTSCIPPSTSTVLGKTEEQPNQGQEGYKPVTE